MHQGIRLRAAIGWLAVGLVVGLAIALGTILITGVSVADEAGRPIGVDAVSVQPAPTPSSTPTPTPSPSSSSEGVVDPPDPIEVELGDDHGGDDGSDDNSGHGGGGSGSDD
jgi:hypothetical protein